MLPSGSDSLELMTPAEVIGLVRRLLGEMERMRAEREKVDAAFARLQVENQTLKDEFARLKGLPPRPPHKPSGMEKATDRPERGAKGDEEEATKRRRAPGVSELSIDRTETLSVEAPAGSRHKGYEDIIVQDLAVKAEATRYRRQRWETPDGERLTAPLPAGIVGGCGPHLHRLVLTPAFSGPDDLREDRGASGRPGPGDLQAPGGAAPARQARGLPRFEIGDAEGAQVAHPFLARAKDTRRMAGELVDDVLRQVGASHVGDRRPVDDVAGRAAEQTTQESQARLSRRPSRHPRPRNPQPRNPRQPRPKLTDRPEICPSYVQKSGAKRSALRPFATSKRLRS